MCAAALSAVLGGCGAPSEIVDMTETESQAEPVENLVRSSPGVAMVNNLDGAEDIEPFSTYTYDFSVAENNYMITVVPDEKGTGLTLTVENNQFEFSKFSVTPPDNYMVWLPYSQQYASQVCTVIKGSSGDKDVPEAENIPDLLKIDFYLMNFDNEALPYSVSRLYSIINDRLVEVEVYDTVPPQDDDNGGETSEVKARDRENFLEPMDYIPESVMYQTESLTFMPEPTVTVKEDGSFETEVFTYTLNPDDMTMRRKREECTPENPLYYGYAAHAVAGNIYQYFISTSLNVSDYENYVEIPSADGGEDKYFFKVDDPRFSTKDELREYVSRYFDEKIVNRMFLKAPQQYCDIDGELYTILGDGGVNEKLGKLTITSWDIDGNVITYHTKQEKLTSEGALDGYIDGGDFVIETLENGGFIVKEYRYPTES